MRAEAEQYYSGGRGAAWLWAGVLIGPVAWILSQQVSYVIAAPLCAQGLDLLLHVIPLVGLTLSLAGAWISWRNWKSVGLGFSEREGGTIARTQFMAAFGLIFCGFFSIVIIAEWIPNFFLGPCTG